MAGIYIHIPFCKKACHYCNFHFSTNLSLMDEMTKAIVIEIQQRADELKGEDVHTIYFGGGTPSILPLEQLSIILNELHRNYSIVTNPEITLESNPDDLKGDKYKNLRGLGVNRLSVGIQSFNASDLQWMNRVHTAEEAESCINRAVQGGFEHFSLDLIYGIPSTSHDVWLANLSKVNELPVNHLSCYALTVEDNTALAHFIKKGKVRDTDDQHQIDQYNLLLDWADDSGFDLYEISNLAKDGHYSIHNTSYWFGAKYIGIGPGAHSFDGNSRRYNIANNPSYIKSLNSNKMYYETEILLPETHYNEWIMTRLRTKWGIDKEALEQWERSTEFYLSIKKWIDGGKVEFNGKSFVLTRAGLLWADGIAADLFV